MRLYGHVYTHPVSLNRTPIIVLGVHRSGTSAMSGALNKLGVYFGLERDLFPADDKNQTGYFELNDQMALNRKLRKAFFAPSGSVEALPENWRDYPASPDLAKSVSSFLTKHFSVDKLWGFKEPYTTVLLPIYKEAFAQQELKPHYLLCVRNPLNVMESWNRSWYSGNNRRGEPSFGVVTLGLWVLFTLYALHETRGASRSVVMFQDFLSDPITAIKPTAELIEGWAPTQDEWDTVRKSVRPELSHAVANLDELATLPTLITRTYDLCQRLSKDLSGLNQGDFDPEIESLYSECAQTIKMFAVPLSAKAHFDFYWTVGGEKRTAEFDMPYQSWTSVKVPINAPPKTEVQVALYPNPSVVWFRAANLYAHGKLHGVAIRPGLGNRVVPDSDTQRLTSVQSAHQFSFVTPSTDGPYEFEADILALTHYSMAFAGAAELANQLAATQLRIDSLEKHALDMEEKAREATRKF